MDRAPRPSESVLHVVCFEERGEPTLRHVAAVARPGDGVLVFGPASFARLLREPGRLGQPVLDAAVEVIVAPRIGGSFGRVAAVSGGVETAARIARFGAAVLHGPRAGLLLETLGEPLPGLRPSNPAFAGACFAQRVPDQLPESPAWTPERRARVRRELGLLPREIAVLCAGEPSAWVDLSFVARVVGMAFVSGAPLRIVVSPRVPRLAEVARFLVLATGSPEPIVDVRADWPWELLPALDAAIVDRDGAATRPEACRGMRSRDLGELLALRGARDEPSAHPALWAVACGRRVFAHAEVDLGAHSAHPGVSRFSDAIAPFAHALGVFAREVQETRARSPIAASR